MNLEQKKETVAYMQEVYSGSCEQPVDLDITLPDYCSDILRILKCIVTPQIEHRKISGDRLTIDGKTQIILLYTDDEETQIKSCELSTPFSLDFQQKSTYQEPLIKSDVRVDFFNCRCVTKRRVDIHGAFTIFAKILCKAEDDILVDAQGCYLQTNYCCKEIDSLVGSASQYFTINEQLELAQNSPTIQMIVKSEVCAYLDDCKAIAGKLIAKGQAIIKIIYKCDDNDTLGRAEFTIPVSQIIDIANIDDECICDCDFEVLGYTVTQADGINGFDVDLKCCYTVKAYQNKKINLITDCYSTKYPTTIDKKPVALYHIADTIQDIFTAKGDLTVGEDGVDSIVDVWGEVSSKEYELKEEKLNIFGKLTMCIVMKNSKGQLVYIERPIDYSYERNLTNCTDISISPILTIKNISYRINSDNIEVKCDISLSATIFCNIKENVIDNIVVSDTAPLDESDFSPLLIYYSQENQPVWDIAKHYNTTVKAIMEENSLTTDTVEKHKMLLIPVQ